MGLKSVTISANEYPMTSNEYHSSCHKNKNRTISPNDSRWVLTWVLMSIQSVPFTLNEFHNDFNWVPMTPNDYPSDSSEWLYHIRSLNKYPTDPMTNEYQMDLNDSWWISTTPNNSEGFWMSIPWPLMILNEYSMTLLIPNEYSMTLFDSQWVFHDP